MKSAAQRFLARRDSIQKVFLFLMATGLVVYFAGFLINAGEGWPITRDGINLFWASLWTGVLYSIINYFLSKVGIKSKSVSLVIAIPLSIVLFVMLLLFALSGMT